MTRRRQPRLAALTLGAALALALLWVIVVPLLAGRPGGRVSLLQEPSLLPLLALVCGGPLLLFAALMTVARLERRRAVRALVAGMLATSGFWALYHGWAAWDAAIRVSADANIGRGLLMLASPLLVAAAMTLAYQFPGTPPGPDSR